MTLPALSDGWRERVPALLAWSCLLLLPFGRLVEGAVGVMAILGIVHAVRARAMLLADPRMRLLLLLFAVYWLPMMLSVPDAVNVGRAVGSTAAQLRFLFVGVYLVGTLSAAGLALFLRLAAWLLLFWMADALLQYYRGTDLFGLEGWSNRLSGVFGRGNSKFGLTITVFLPLLWEWLRQRAPSWLLVIAVPASIAFVMLSGSRAAWITVVVAAACYCLLAAWRARRLNPRMLAAGALVLVLGALTVYQSSDRVRVGVDNAIDGITGQGEKLRDNSVYHRYWIWLTATRMFLDNPVNGVGARNFRNAYEQYASADDPFYHGPRGETPAHSHQLLLETATETGTIGLIGLLALWLLMARAVLRGAREGPPVLLAVAAGLAGAYFPLNTHLAVYSSYWSQILWFLVVMFCVCAERGPAARVANE